MKDMEIFDGKNFSDLLQEIHTVTVHKRKRIDELITDVRKLVKTPEDLVVVAPIIVNYLEVMVKNDDHLIKIAAIVQKIIALESKVGAGGSLEDLLSDDEKEKLLKEAMHELDEAAKELEVETPESGK